MAEQPSSFTLLAPVRIVHPASGVTLMEVGLGEQGPHLHMYDYQGRLRISLDACPSQGVTVEVCTPEGESLASLTDGGPFGGIIEVAHPGRALPGHAGIRVLLLAEEPADEAADEAPRGAGVLEIWRPGPRDRRLRLTLDGAGDVDLRAFDD